MYRLIAVFRSSALDKSLNVNSVYGSVVRRQPLLSKKSTAARLEFAKKTRRGEKKREKKRRKEKRRLSEECPTDGRELVGSNEKCPVCRKSDTAY